MNQRIKALLQKPGWNQARLSKELKISVAAVKTWTLKNPENRKTPNKWVMVELEKILDREGC